MGYFKGIARQWDCSLGVAPRVCAAAKQQIIGKQRPSGGACTAQTRPTHDTSASDERVASGAAGSWQMGLMDDEQRHRQTDTHA
eukprot:scaffold9957_cov107-Isochrysis_galbana.AAC.2